jgi:UDP-N-acetylglucosamine--N-acetylmuramyl-(pentapeptide) pyrophosphoryl-undecaprenol N-acetylglucosamine transferase
MSTDGLRVLIAGGGTGGHLFPGLAVARELQSRVPGAMVTFAGTAQGIESRVVPREGFELDVIRSSGLKGKGAGDRMRGAARLPLSLVDAWKLITRRRPRLVIGVGGYSSGPLVLVAAMRRIPTLLLEQNAVPGLTNRLLARVVDAAAVSYDQTREFFGSKAFVSGNPVRAEFFGSGQPSMTVEAYASRSGSRILVFGGSQGAHAINVVMVEAAPRLAANHGAALSITHQTGERDVDVVRAAYRSAGIESEVVPFLDDMGRRLAEADVVVCRAGATTLAEIAAAGAAAILVPLPTATDDHQRRNAEALAEKGAAEVLLQSDATGTVLAERIAALIADRPRRQRMAAAARGCARPDAARVIVDRALALVGGRPGTDR